MSRPYGQATFRLLSRRSTSAPSRRFFSSKLRVDTLHIGQTFRRHPVAWGLGASSLLVLTGIFAVGGKDPTLVEAEVDLGDRDVLKTIPLSKLLSGWFVYTCCSIPMVVDASPTILSILSNIPIVSSVANAVIRRTFFAQFCGGETAEDCKSTVCSLRDRNIGSLLSCRLEAAENGSAVTNEEIAGRFHDVLSGIEASGECERKYVNAEDMAHGSTRSWISLKMSGLLADADILIRASNAIIDARSPEHQQSGYYPGIVGSADWSRLVGKASKLSESDLEALRNLMASLRMLSKRSAELGVRIFIDAEQTWYQPATDLIQEQLMREFNVNRVPIICGTVQAYLRRCDVFLQNAFDRAAEGGYSFGFKLVRGAYMDSERKRWTAQGRAGPSPCWDSKDETDACFERALTASIEQIAKHRAQPDKYADICLMIASHHTGSIAQAADLIVKNGLGETVSGGQVKTKPGVGDRLAFAQICGMKDALTNNISSRFLLDNGLPAGIKLLPFGTLENSMPYLARRAIENKSIMAGAEGASRERGRLGDEILRRMGLASF